MLVTLDNFNIVCDDISRAKVFSVDTETTGLRPYSGDRLFAIIFATEGEEFYFNYNENGPTVLPWSTIQALSPLFTDPQNLIIFANAKFDMHFLYQAGVTDFKAKIYDVLSQERLFYNDYIRYNLDETAKRYGFKKLSVVEDYIKQHKLTSKASIPGKKKTVTLKHYDKVPFEIMFEYAKQDARITYDIYKKQIIRPKTMAYREVPFSIYEMENKLLPVCYRMEQHGVLIDENFALQKANEETIQYESVAREFHDKTGQAFIDSPKALGPLFKQAGFNVPKTEKGSDSITDKWLASISHPLSDLVVKYREHYKLANTYYKNFIWFKDDNGFMHPSFVTNGTRTGRMSSREPNMQNCPKDHELRKSFLVPKDFVWVSIDYDQQEYRLMLDYANEQSLIKQVLDGLDVHAATSNMVGVSRQEAKTLNFMLLYGGGVVKLCLALFKPTVPSGKLWAMWKEENDWDMEKEEQLVLQSVTQEEKDLNMPLLHKASVLRDLYFSKLPKVSKLISEVKEKAKVKGYVTTWAGRRLHFNRNNFYKAPNGLIQGGCGDISKYGMIAIDNLLMSRKSKMIIQVHDQLDFIIHKDELEIVHEIKHAMESVYPQNHLPLTTSVSYSYKNWGELVEGLPNGKEAGNEV